MNEEAATPLLPSIHNPFDFANPVSVKDLFVGRRKELEDIAYYLNHAKSAPRTINLALLGERASGKTSLLNIIEMESMERSLVPVRINLNESDVDSHLSFWFKIFDSILSRAVTEKLGEGPHFVFNGELGRTYEAYLDMVTAYEIPKDKGFCPFLFPIMFAKAMAAGNTHSQVSDSIIGRDLKVLAKEVGRPIVILMDECNLLSSKRALLEMVRNTFMNLSGYILVFTGTPDLFPLMDEVFSPIIRQFKRIEVSPFARLVDTRDAVKKPLQSVGKETLFEMPPTELFEEPNDRNFNYRIIGELQDLHDLTGGRPYEIQLVCHFMFRRVQQQQDRRMRLSIEVLEDVLRELRQSHDVDTRPIISAVKKLDRDELRCLDVLLRSAGRIPIDELLFAAYVTFKTDDLPDAIRLRVSKFVDAGIIEQKEEKISFMGDDFDKIVCKYAARQREVHLSFDPVQSRGLILSHLLVAGAYQGKPNTRRRSNSSLLRHLFYDRVEENVKCGFFELWDQLDGMPMDSVFKKDASLFAQLYEHVVEAGKSVAGPLILFRVRLDSALVFDELFHLRNGTGIDGKLQEVQSHLEKFRLRVERLGGNVTIEQKALTPCSMDDLFRIAQESLDDELKESCATRHESLMFDSYLKNKDKKEAFRHAELVLQMRQYLPKDELNRLGYVLLASNKFKEAEDVLAESIESTSDEEALSRYNHALAMLMQGKSQLAMESLVAVLKRIDSEDNNIAVLFFIEKRGDGQLQLVERWSKEWEPSSAWDSISLNDAAKSALAICGDT